MYAIVEIAGRQFKVEENKSIFVNRLNAGEGDKLEFDKVLLFQKEGDVKVGTPSVAGAKVTATVVGHIKGDKIIVFKKKRRKGYAVKRGHRQQFTKIQIESINA